MVAEPGCQAVYQGIVSMKKHFDETLEAERNDQFAEYPFDDGLKCNIFWKNLAGR